MKQNDFEYKEEYSYLISALLNVTDDCNLQCRYCFVEQNPHYMTLDTAKAAADFLYQNYQKRIINNCLKSDNKVSIYFFGGEPMLCYNSIIVPLVKYCRETYPDIPVSFGMTTNGTLLNKEFIDFLSENKFSILLSIDGAKATQDYNRPCKNNQSSFDLIEKNIPYLLEKFPDICFRSTIYAPTVEHLFENYLYAESLGFKRYEMIEDNRHENLWTQDKLKILSNQFASIYFHRLEQIINGIKPLQVNRINQWFINTMNIFNNEINFSEKSHITSIERCGLGTISGSIGWDGNIYGCQEQTSKGPDSFFYIGNIFNGGINQQKHFDLLKFYIDNQLMLKEKKEKCQNCNLNELCKINFHICPSTTYDLYQDMNSITEINCFIRQLYFNNSILNLEIFYQFGGMKLLQEILDGEDE